MVLTESNPNKKPDATSIIIRSDKKRFCDTCNVQILSDSICPKCGRYYEYKEGKRELIIKGLDGKTKHGDANVILSIQEDKPKPKDPMPRSFKNLERHGFKITSWTDSSQ